MRYAIYFTPDAEDPLTAAAQAWLGRNAWTGEPVDRAVPAGFTDAEFEQVTAAPRRYGFHATLVAPFRLRDGIQEDDVMQAARHLAQTCAPFAIPRLEVTRIGNFLALTPAMPCQEMDALASSAVDHFNPLRAPLIQSDIERRRPACLTPRQRSYIDRFGYPYVKDEFRFHMTLTSALEPDLARRIEPAIRAHFAPILDRPVPVEAVTVFIEPKPGGDFIVHSTHRFGSAQPRKSA